MTGKNRNDNAKEVLAYGIVAFMFLVAVLAALALSALNDKKGDSTPIDPDISQKPSAEAVETVPEDAISAITRDISSLELVEIPDWENHPYEIHTPEQIKLDLETLNAERDSDLEFAYVQDENVIFTLQYSDWRGSAYLYSNEGRCYDFKDWSMFLSDENIIFFTDETDIGLREAYTFVLIDSQGNTEEAKIYLDLLGAKKEITENADQIFTLNGADVTIVQKGTTLYCIRKGECLSVSEFPENVKVDTYWDIYNYIVGDDGTLYAIMVDKSKWDEVKLVFQKLGENIDEDNKIFKKAYTNANNDFYFDIFANKDGEYITFAIDGEIWKDCSLSSNRVWESNREEKHTPQSEWKIEEVSLQKPDSFKLVYSDNEGGAYWFIEFFYGDVHTSSRVPGIDDSIFLDETDVEQFDGNIYDIEMLDTVSKDLIAVYDKYIDEAYQNYLK